MYETGLPQRHAPEHVAAASCYHCGDSCDALDITHDGKHFCCNGCKTVYDLLAEKNLCGYYTMDKAGQGITPKDRQYTRRFEFLDDESIVTQLLSFADGETAVVSFAIPGMHCSSCIWLLERLTTLHTGIASSRVNFPRKEVTITYRKDAISLREIVVLLASIGYEPLINLQSIAEKKRHTGNRALYYKIGVAGFAFGNVMLLSFPEYLASEGTLDPAFRQFFGLVNLFLSLPVFFYSSLEFFVPAWVGLRQRFLNIDVPLSLGIVILFLRSAYEVLTQTGAGYLDSFTGLVFFMLIGRIFQKKSYDALSFDRDFRSYFPLWVTVKHGDRESSIPLTKLAVGDRMIVRNQEIVPADAVLMRGDARIDYSFVTGEADLVPKSAGDLVYAGGRQSGTAIELEVVKEISQSYLTRLWNDDVFTKATEARLPTFVNRISRAFTAVLLVIAFGAGIYWSFEGLGMAVVVFTAVLIVACPCALALSSPFAFGSVQRIFGNNQFYIKNTETIEALAHIDTIVFDKTGTLTHAAQPAVEYLGDTLGENELRAVKALARQSTHTLSRQLAAAINDDGTAAVADFEERPGAGVRGNIDGLAVRIGSAEWTDAGAVEHIEGSSAVHVKIGDAYKGAFVIANAYRKGIEGLVARLARHTNFAVLSGDSNRDEGALRGMFGADVPMSFGQSPEDKMREIERLRAEGRHVLMVGDGLNDAGALKAAQVGISVSEDINTFSPACDAILSATQFPIFDRFIRAARASVIIVKTSFVISLAYNVVGLGFAVTGMLSPLVSAVLMPLSSVSAVAFTTIATRLAARRIGLR